MTTSAARANPSAASDTAATRTRVVRTAVEDDWPEIRRLDELAFNWDTSDAWMEAMRSAAETDRMLCAREGRLLVGVAGAYTFRMSVPGADLPIAGVSWVGVLPTRRRRGVLRDLMRHQLDQLRAEEREAVAVLTASEPPIYGRFGYGLASREVGLAIPRAADALVPAAPRDESIELSYAEPAAALPETSALYESLRPTRPGQVTRGQAWERALISEAPEAAENASGLRCVLARDGERLRGYARFRVSKQTPAQVRLHDLVAADPASHATLWRFLLDLDLTTGVHAPRLAVDDPLLRLLADARAASPQVRDGGYLRLVDLPRALAARRYGRPIDVVVAVRDEFCPWNEGRWRLSGDERGACCERTADPAELRLDVRELGSVYLGDASLAGLGAAGLVEAERPSALAAASAAFAHDPLPWLSLAF